MKNVDPDAGAAFFVWGGENVIFYKTIDKGIEKW